MTDEQTAAAAAELYASIRFSSSHSANIAAIVRALQAARKEGGKQVVDEAERVSKILQSANTANADNEAKARFEVDRFAFACAGSVVGSTLTDYQKHALFHQFKNVFDSHESALQAARESALDTHANAAVLRMCHEARMMNGIVDYSDPKAVGMVRKLKGEFPITADGVMVQLGEDVWHPESGEALRVGEYEGDADHNKMPLADDCTFCAFYSYYEIDTGYSEYEVYDVRQCYSTPEAAEAAKEAKA